MAEQKSQTSSTRDIRFNEENKVKAILACIPIVGLILLFVEKEDQFVRYYGALYTMVGIVGLILSFIMMIIGVVPIIGWILACLSPLVSLAILILIVIGMVKANNGEKFELPMLTDYAFKLMDAIK